jgi:hypothetical protein
VVRLRLRFCCRIGLIRRSFRDGKRGNKGLQVMVHIIDMQGQMDVILRIDMLDLISQRYVNPLTVLATPVVCMYVAKSMFVIYSIPGSV